MDERLVRLIGTVFPVGTKRRWLLSSVAGLLGMVSPIPEIGSTPGSTVFDVLTEDARALDKDGKVYWASVRNLMKIKTGLFLSDPENALEFPVFDAPAVSILLVTFNSAEYTFQCLETIKAHSDVPYEVIIVDNASTDRTGDLLGQTRNVKVIMNGENAGFLKACNKGARAASGKYILFLNNDTQVTPGWLAGLVSTMEGYPGCGAVGGKLIMPDGRLQEAGCVIWKDGSTSGYGRGANPFVPEVSYVREVDYCGGACLLVRKDLFLELGGFDERYAPAYYEEADLCMGVRSRGFKVVYQPSVSVVHYEYGSGSFKKALRMAQANQAKFFTKWKDSLEGHCAPSSGNMLYARDKRRGRRVLMIDDGLPAGGQDQKADLLARLSGSGCAVTLFITEPGATAHPRAKELRHKGVEVICDEERSGALKFSKTRSGLYDLILLCGAGRSEISKGIGKYFEKAVIMDGDLTGVMEKINGPRDA